MKKIIISLCLVLGLAMLTLAQDKTEVFVQSEHAGSVDSVAFSPDGKYVLSGSYDKTLKLWETATGREIRTFTGHSSFVYSIAFSPDGKYALSGSWDNTLKLWDVATGQEIRTFTGHEHDVHSVAFSPDGKFALSGSGDRTLKLWDTATGREIRTFKGHSDYVNSIAFSPDGKYALSGSSDDTLKLWDVATGKEIRTFTGHSSYVRSVAFSSDGQYALSGSKDKTLKLWDTATGREIRTFTGHSDDVDSVAFSPDGQYALSGSEDKTLKLWDTATGREIRTFKGHSYSVGSVAFSPDGQYALSGNFRILKLWDVTTGKKIRTFQRYSDYVNSIAFSPDGQYALSGSSDYTLKLWETATGRKIRAFTGHSSYVKSVAFSLDGQYALSGSWDDTLKLWDTATGREIRTFTGHTDNVISVAFSPDGQYALSGSEDKTLKLWETATGKEIRTFTGHSNCVDSVAFSPDGQYALSGSSDFTLKLWDTATGREIRTFNSSTDAPSVAFSPDGKYALSGGSSGTFGNYNILKLWDVATGKEIRTFQGHSKKITSVAFSPDGQYALYGSEDETLKLWEVATWQEIRTFTGHSDNVKSVAFSPDGQYALSGSSDSTMRLWKIATGQEIAQMVSFPDGEWVCITPEGYYNSSANGDKYLNVSIGKNVYGIDQYRSTFYKPEVVEAALRLGDSRKAITQVLGSKKQAVTVATMQNIEPPFVIIKSPANGCKLNSIDTTLAIYLEDRHQPIKSVKVYINGRLMTSEGSRGISIAPKSPASPSGGGVQLESKGIDISGEQKSLDLAIPIKLDSGNNVIEVTASNGFAEGRKTITVYSAQPATAASSEVILPNLWILAIGINKYSDKKINSLTYAAADAEGIVRAFATQKGRLFRDVKSLLISDNSSLKPTYENIIDNLRYLSKAGSNDVVVLFIAGHGLNDERGNYYFLPSDAAIRDDGTIKESKAISWRSIKSVLDLPAKKIVLVDTCHAEGVSGKKTRAVDNDRFAKELQEANAVIFTSSRGRELSQEDDQWKHGAFTYAIIEGLSGKADLIKDNKISMKELDTYVSETVPQITNGAQHPITITPDGYVNFPVALIK